MPTPSDTTDPAKPHQWLQSLERFSEYTGRGIAWLTLLMIVCTFVVVIVQKQTYINFNTTILYELALYAHACIFMFGISYTFKHNSHVRVDIFYRKFSQAAQARIDLVGTLLLLFPVAVFIFVNSWEYVQASWSIWEASPNNNGLPLVFLLKTVMLVMPVLLIGQGIATALRCWLVLRHREPILHADHDPREF